MTCRPEELPQAELPGDAAEQLARREVDRLRRRRGLSIGVALDLRDVVARVGGRVAVHRVVVEHTEHLRHRDQPPSVLGCPGIQWVPARGSLAIAAASTVSATMSSGSRLWTWDF